MKSARRGWLFCLYMIIHYFCLNINLVRCFQVRMKKFAYLLFVLLATVFNVTCVAAENDFVEIECSDSKFMFKVLDESAHTCELVRFTLQNTYAPVIPASVKIRNVDYSVISIGDRAFLQSFIEKITLPPTIEHIGKFAFYSTNIQELYLPKSVKTIDEFSLERGLYRVDKNNRHFSSENGVLYNKKKTELIYVPNNTTGKFVVPKSVVTLGTGAFDNCSKITEIVLPKSLKIIRPCCFNACKGLKDIKLPNSLDSIFYDAFRYCDFNEIDIPESVRYIDSKSFSCKVNVSRDNEKYSSVDGLLYTKDMTTLLNAPIDIEGEIVLPEGLQKIEEGVFQNCEKLTKITFPKTLKTIGKNSFNWCRNLKEVVIPASVDSIGYWAFDCNMVVDNQNKSYYSEDGVLYNKDKTKIVRFPSSRQGEFSIPNTVIDIENCCFRESKLSSIIIPNSVKTMGYQAFGTCKIDTLTIPNSVEYIGNSAFSFCTHIKNLIIPESVKKIDNGAFVCCYGMKTIEIQNPSVLIGEAAFRSCMALEKLVLPKGLKREEIWELRDRAQILYK